MNPLKIIVADDEPLLVEELCIYLQDLNHEVIATTNSGQELCDKALELKPDLIISDIKMPEMDGIEAITQINKQITIPILIVSAYHDQDFIDKASEQCVMGYLVKPIDERALKINIQVAMRRFQEFEVLRKENKDLEQALSERKIIERAKGILMSRSNLTEPEAFQKLQDLSRKKSTRMVEIAQSVITAEEAFKD